MTDKRKLAPSLLAADFAALKAEIAAVEAAGAHYLHLDIMDGHFVPNISFGVPVIKSLRKITGMTFDVHLMISRPERYIAAFADAGADIINVHAEACADIAAAAAQIKGLGKRAALTLKPATDIAQALPFLPEISLVLVMGVEPGFGGQALLPHTLRKAEQLANHIARENLAVEIEMDGGIGLDNVRGVLDAGVDVVVAGSSVFRAANPAEAVKAFCEIFQNTPQRPVSS